MELDKNRRVEKEKKEELIFAAEDKALGTNIIKAWNEKQNVSPKCRT